MVRLLIIFCILTSSLSFAQTSGVSEDEKNFTLQQRYVSIKGNAETYQDYKVIKEYVLDGFWKVTLDSMKEQKNLVKQANQTTSKLETKLLATKDTLASERAAVTQIVHDSHHISILGIDFKKSMFIIFVVAVFLLLLFIGGAMIARIRLVQATAHEKIILAEAIASEFDEFKKKSMEKQIKLARELQNERNKVADLKQGAAH
jgi:hypothetical protein